MSRVGVVIIGRNEGERLRRCLNSLVGGGYRLAYVESGSSDGSVELAREMGALVIELDRSVPFTAARARNAGLDALLEAAVDLEFVQFVDGDCEVVAGWMERALRELASDEVLAVVCGRRRERYPGASVYNRLCDIEWNTPIGIADACGGDAMMRVAPVRELGGYNPELIAGEEPDLCLRLRRRGFKIRRVDAEMTLHDAAMTRFSQWWRRSLRAGHAFAEGSALHGRGPERYWVRETRSNWVWGMALPLAIAGSAVATRGASLLGFGGYALLYAKTLRALQRQGMDPNSALLYAAACVAGKLPQSVGQLTYWVRRVSGRREKIIEYKTA
jgi:GT2 family glycosyltransferase